MVRGNGDNFSSLTTTGKKFAIPFSPSEDSVKQRRGNSTCTPRSKLKTLKLGARISGWHGIGEPDESVPTRRRPRLSHQVREQLSLTFNRSQLNNFRLPSLFAELRWTKTWPTLSRIWRNSCWAGRKQSEFSDRGGILWKITFWIPWFYWVSSMYFPKLGMSKNHLSLIVKRIFRHLIEHVKSFFPELHKKTTRNRWSSHLEKNNIP